MLTNPAMPDPTMTRDAEILNRVLERHGLNQAELADLANYSESMMSRVCSGQYSVPAQVFIRLYAKTRDAELLEHMTGSDPRTRSPDHALFADAVTIQQRAHAIAERLYNLAQGGGLHKADPGFLGALGNDSRDLANRLSGLSSRAHTAEMQVSSMRRRLPSEGVVA
jgi:transcriptional regulator with XRE-family HTH domain